MATLKHATYGTFTTYLSSGLDALADAGKVLGTEIDNTAALDLYYDFELNVTFGSSPTLGNPVDLYVIPAIGGTDYADGSSTVEPAESLRVGSFDVRNVNTAQRLALLNILVPPAKFKVLIRNSAGQAFSASGHTLKYRPHNLGVN